MKRTNSSVTADPPKALVAALSRVLRPLVKLLLTFHITFPFLAQLLKRIYIEVAIEEFALEAPGQKDKISDSRVSLLTGVHRKDVKKLRSDASEVVQVPTSVSIGSQVINTWMTFPRFAPAGNPLPLPRTSTSSVSPSFEELVQQICKHDIRVKVVLDELLRIGVVSLDEADVVHLNQEAFIPQQGFDEKAYFFGRMIHDHMAASAHNLLDNKPPFFDRCVYYNHLTPESCEALGQWVSAHGMPWLRQLNEKAKQHQVMDKKSAHGSQRMHLGIYYYCTGEAYEVAPLLSDEVESEKVESGKVGKKRSPKCVGREKS